MDDHEREDWGDLVDAALDSPDAATIAVPRELLIAVDAEWFAGRNAGGTLGPFWFILGVVVGVFATAGYVAMVVYA